MLTFALLYLSYFLSLFIIPYFLTLFFSIEFSSIHFGEFCFPTFKSDQQEQEDDTSSVFEHQDQEHQYPTHPDDDSDEEIEGYQVDVELFFNGYCGSTPTPVNMDEPHLPVVANYQPAPAISPSQIPRNLNLIPLLTDQSTQPLSWTPIYSSNEPPSSFFALPIFNIHHPFYRQMSVSDQFFTFYAGMEKQMEDNVEKTVSKRRRMMKCEFEGSFRRNRTAKVSRALDRRIERFCPYKRKSANEYYRLRQGVKGWPLSIKRSWAYRSKRRTTGDQVVQISEMLLERLYPENIKRRKRFTSPGPPLPSVLNDNNAPIPSSVPNSHLLYPHRTASSTSSGVVGRIASPKPNSNSRTPPSLNFNFNRPADRVLGKRLVHEMDVIDEGSDGGLKRRRTIKEVGIRSTSSEPTSSFWTPRTGFITNQFEHSTPDKRKYLQRSSPSPPEACEDGPRKKRRLTEDRSLDMSRSPEEEVNVAPITPPRDRDGTPELSHTPGEAEAEVLVTPPQAPSAVLAEALQVVPSLTREASPSPSPTRSGVEEPSTEVPRRRKNRPAPLVLGGNPDPADDTPAPSPTQSKPRVGLPQMVRRNTSTGFMDASLDGFTRSPTTAMFHDGPTTLVEGDPESRLGNMPPKGNEAAKIAWLNKLRRLTTQLPYLQPTDPSPRANFLHARRQQLAHAIKQELDANPISPELITLIHPPHKQPEPRDPPLPISPLAPDSPNAKRAFNPESLEPWPRRSHMRDSVGVHATYEQVRAMPEGRRRNSTKAVVCLKVLRTKFSHKFDKYKEEKKEREAQEEYGELGDFMRALQEMNNGDALAAQQSSSTGGNGNGLRRTQSSSDIFGENARAGPSKRARSQPPTPTIALGSPFQGDIGSIIASEYALVSPSVGPSSRRNDGLPRARSTSRARSSLQPIRRSRSFTTSAPPTPIIITSSTSPSLVLAPPTLISANLPYTPATPLETLSEPAVVHESSAESITHTSSSTSPQDNSGTIPLSPVEALVVPPISRAEVDPPEEKVLVPTGELDTTVEAIVVPLISQEVDESPEASIVAGVSSDTTSTEEASVTPPNSLEEDDVAPEESVIDQASSSTLVTVEATVVPLMSNEEVDVAPEELISNTNSSVEAPVVPPISREEVDEAPVTLVSTSCTSSDKEDRGGAGEEVKKDMSVDGSILTIVPQEEEQVDDGDGFEGEDTSIASDAPSIVEQQDIAGTGHASTPTDKDLIKTDEPTLSSSPVKVSQETVIPSPQNAKPATAVAKDDPRLKFTFSFPSITPSSSSPGPTAPIPSVASTAKPSPAQVAVPSTDTLFPNVPKATFDVLTRPVPPAQLDPKGALSRAIGRATSSSSRSARGKERPRGGALSGRLGGLWAAHAARTLNKVNPIKVVKKNDGGELERQLDVALKEGEVGEDGAENGKDVEVMEESVKEGQKVMASAEEVEVVDNSIKEDQRGGEAVEEQEDDSMDIVITGTDIPTQPSTLPIFAPTPLARPGHAAHPSSRLTLLDLVRPQARPPQLLSIFNRTANVPAHTDTEVDMEVDEVDEAPPAYYDSSLPVYTPSHPPSTSSINRFYPITSRFAQHASPPASSACEEIEMTSEDPSSPATTNPTRFGTFAQQVYMPSIASSFLARISGQPTPEPARYMEDTEMHEDIVMDTPGQPSFYAQPPTFRSPRSGPHPAVPDHTTTIQLQHDIVPPHLHFRQPAFYDPDQEDEDEFEEVEIPDPPSSSPAITNRMVRETESARQGISSLTISDPEPSPLPPPHATVDSQVNVPSPPVEESTSSTVPAPVVQVEQPVLPDPAFKWTDPLATPQAVLVEVPQSELLAPVPDTHAELDASQAVTSTSTIDPASASAGDLSMPFARPVTPPSQVSDSGSTFEEMIESTVQPRVIKPLKASAHAGGENMGLRLLASIAEEKEEMDNDSKAVEELVGGSGNERRLTWEEKGKGKAVESVDDSTYDEGLVDMLTSGPLPSWFTRPDQDLADPSHQSQWQDPARDQVFVPSPGLSNYQDLMDPNHHSQLQDPVQGQVVVPFPNLSASTSTPVADYTLPPTGPASIQTQAAIPPPPILTPPPSPPATPPPKEGESDFIPNARSGKQRVLAFINNTPSLRKPASRTAPPPGRSIQLMSPVLTPNQMGEIDEEIDLGTLKDEIKDRTSMPPPNFITFPKQRSNHASSTRSTEASSTTNQLALPPTSLSGPAFRSVVGPSKSTLLTFPTSSARSTETIRQISVEDASKGDTWESKTSFMAAKRESEKAKEEDMKGRTDLSLPPPPPPPSAQDQVDHPQARTVARLPARMRRAIAAAQQAPVDAIGQLGYDPLYGMPTQPTSEVMDYTALSTMASIATLNGLVEFKRISEIPLFDPSIFPCEDRDFPDALLKSEIAVPDLCPAPWRGGDDRWYIDKDGWLSSFDHILGPMPTVSAFPEDTSSPGL